MDLSQLSDAELQKIAGGDADHDAAVKKMSDEDLQRIVSGQPKYSALGAAGMHLANKALGGFSDEINGAVEAAGRVGGIQGLGGPVKDIGLAPRGPTLDWETLRDAYRAARDHERQALKQQELEHPDASMAGNIAGTVASPINKIAKGMSLAKAGATLGGIHALGASEKEDLPGMAADTVEGAGKGALVGGAFQAARAVAPALRNTAEEIATAPAGQRALETVGKIGAKGNEILDNVVPKFARYVFGHKPQLALDAAENAPGALQAAAGGALNATDKVGRFLANSPRLQALAQNSPKAFSALAANIGQRVEPTTSIAKPNQAPVDDERARQAFLSGN